MRLSPGRLVLAVSALVALLPAAVGLPGSAAAAATGSIHPGVTVAFGGVTCTAGPVLRSGKTVYLAIPASCGGIDEGKIQDGCVEAESPVGSPVTIAGAKYRGILAYNSFSRMQLHGVHNPTRCYYNDLALVRINAKDRSRVSGHIAGVSSQKVSAPKAGTAVRIGSSSATAGSKHHSGWELDVTLTGTVSKTQIGTAAVQGGQVVGMLNAIPQGLIPMGTSDVFSLSKELTAARRAPGLRHLELVS
jgi:hypothetical protein